MIDVNARVPIPRGTGATEKLSERLTSYSHTIALDGGFTSASITMVADETVAAAWIQDGVGKHIESSFGGTIAWEGFVDSVEVSVGSLSFVKGPLMDVVNKARVTYQLYTFGGIVPGGQYITDFASDTAAQAAFFILEGDIAGGTLVSDAEATSIRDLYLSEYALPKSKTNFSSTPGEASITLNCVGYYRLLEKYYYLRAVDANIEATDKIKAVLDAEPNGILNGSRSVMNTIGITVNEYEDWSRTGSAIIFELAALGNSSGERMSFGVYEDRTPHLTVVPNEIRYELSAGYNGSILSMANGGPIPLAFVRPGYWIRSRSLPLASRVGSHSRLRVSDRDVLVEQVTFNAPDQLSINGGQFDTFTQRLSRFNFGLT